MMPTFIMRALAETLPASVEYWRSEIADGRHDVAWAFERLESLMKPLAHWLELERKVDECRRDRAEYEARVFTQRQTEVEGLESSENLNGLIMRLAAALGLTEAQIISRAIEGFARLNHFGQAIEVEAARGKAEG